VEEDDPRGFADEVLGGPSPEKSSPANRRHPKSQECFDGETEALHDAHDTAVSRIVL
jgi:hypothetical protein